jgi:hypothetical protein
MNKDATHVHPTHITDDSDSQGQVICFIPAHGGKIQLEGPSLIYRGCTPGNVKPRVIGQIRIL